MLAIPCKMLAAPCITLAASPPYHSNNFILKIQFVGEIEGKKGPPYKLYLIPVRLVLTLTIFCDGIVITLKNISIFNL